MADDNYNFKNSYGHDNNRTVRTKKRLLVIGLTTTMFLLFIFVNANSQIKNHRLEAAPSSSGNVTHQSSPNGTTITNGADKTVQTTKANTNTTENKSSSNSTIAKLNTNSSTSQPNSNVSKLTTTQGNNITNANAPGSPFPPKEANSTSYFPPTNKVAIVVGAALLRDKAYQPNPVNIKAGGVVTWTNEDTVVHTVTSGTGLQDAHLGNQFDSGLLGGHFSHIFFKGGVFPYFCQIHPTMVGKVIVK